MDASDPHRTGPPVDENTTKILSDVAYKNSVTTALSNVRFCQSSQALRELHIYIEPAKPTPIPNSFYYVEEKPLRDFKPIFSIDVTNSYRMFSNDVDSTPFFLVRTNPEYINPTLDGAYAFSDANLASLQSLFTSAIIVREHIKMMAGFIKTHHVVGLVPMHEVDISDLGPRNMLKLADEILSYDTRLSFLNCLRNRYVKTETAADDLVEGIIDNTVDLAIRDRIENYSTYLIPYAQEEINLLNLSSSLFFSMHEHPTVTLDKLRGMSHAGVEISSVTKQIAMHANCSVRVLKNVYEKLDVVDIYIVPNGCLQLRNQIKRMAVVDLQIDSMIPILTNLQQSLRIAPLVNTAKGNYLNHINAQNAAAMLAASHWTLINPNLFCVDLYGLELGSIFNDIYQALSITVVQILFPPNVILESTRMSINNALAYSIVHYHIGKKGYDDMKMKLSAFTGYVLPDYEMSHDWLSYKADIAYALYAVNHSADPWSHITHYILKPYFNGRSVAELDGDVVVSGSIRMKKSLMAPYLLGNTTTEYDRYKASDTFREARSMYKNGALLINKVFVANGNPHVAEISGKFSAMQVLFDTPPGKYNQRNNYVYEPRVLYNSNEVAAIMGMVTQTGINRLAAVLKAYTYELPKYSTSVAADSTVRYVSQLHKEVVTIQVKASFTLLVCPNTEVVFNHELSAPMYAGISIMSEMQLFLLFYRRVTELLPKAPPAQFTTTQKVSLASQLMEIVTGTTNYDAKKAFGYEQGDPATWNDFLDNESRKVEKHHAYVTFSSVISQILRVVENGVFKAAIVSKFYLVKEALMLVTADYSGPVLAASTLRRGQINVKHTIHDIGDYARLRNNHTREGQVVDTTFLSLWRDLYAPSREGLMKPDAKVDAIEVHFRAKLDLHFVREKGQFHCGIKMMGSSHQDFTDQLDLATSGPHSGDVSHIPMFKIPITYILNDIGSTRISSSVWQREKVFYGTLEALPTCQMVVPYEEITTHLYRYTDLLQLFTNRLTVRDEPIQVLSDFEVHYDRKV